MEGGGSSSSNKKKKNNNNNNNRKGQTDKSSSTKQKGAAVGEVSAEQSPSGSVRRRKEADSNPNPKAKARAKQGAAHPQQQQRDGSSLPVRRKAELLLQVEGNRQAFMKLLYATLLMILVPVPTYFLLYHGSSWVGLGWSDNVRAVVGGVGAVGMVQVIIIGYIVSAFRE